MLLLEGICLTIGIAIRFTHLQILNLHKYRRDTTTLLALTTMSHLESLKFKPSKPLKLAFTYDRQAEWIEQGFSMDECLEFQDDKTIEAIASALRELGTVEMVGSAKSLTKRLAASKHDWDLVFNFCEGYGTVGREAQVPAILEAHGIPFTFSDSAAMALCQDKAKAKVSFQSN